MINKQKEIKEKIAALIEKAYLAAAEEGALPSCEYGSIEIEPTKDKSHGDFATNFALKTSKLLKKNHSHCLIFTAKTQRIIIRAKILFSLICGCVIRKNITSIKFLN